MSSDPQTPCKKWGAEAHACDPAMVKRGGAGQGPEGLEASGGRNSQATQDCLELGGGARGPTLSLPSDLCAHCAT